MTQTKWTETLVLTIALTLGAAGSRLASATESVADSAKEVAQDVKKAGKKAIRAADDKACPMVDGKAQCAVKKGKHKLQNAGDEAKDKLND